MPGAHVKATKPPFGHDLGEYFATVSFAEAHFPVPPSPSAKTNLVVIGAKGAGPGGGDATAGGGGLFATVLEEEEDMEPAASAQASMAIRCSGWERSMVLDEFGRIWCFLCHPSGQTLVASSCLCQNVHNPVGSPHIGTNRLSI